MEVVLEMLFLILSNADIQFAKEELTWRFYTTKKTLPTTRWVKLINKKEFAKVILDENVKAFVVYMASFTLKMLIYPARKTQIALFMAKRVTVTAEYLNFANVFSKDWVKVLSKRTGINKHTINLEDSKQPPYRPIYSLSLVELETLKNYIKTNLANSFIQPLKSPIGALILFVCKPNNSLLLCINYRSLNNLIIKKWYLFPLIGESLNRLE